MFLSLQLLLSQSDVEMDTQSCMDHSILAIFEDSTVASEVRVKADCYSNPCGGVTLGVAQLSKK